MTVTEFQDPNFKLAVLDVLFDLGHFDEELEGILAFPEDEFDPFEVNPRRWRALMELPVTQHQLDEIKQFSPDGGDDVYAHVLPGGRGEEDELYIDRFDDISMLRNLEWVSVHAMTAEHAFDLGAVVGLQNLRSVQTNMYFLRTETLAGARQQLIERGVGVEITGA